MPAPGPKLPLYERLIGKRLGNITLPPESGKVDSRLDFAKSMRPDSKEKTMAGKRSPGGKR